MRTGVIPDIHIPFEDKNAIKSLLQWIRTEKPDRLVFLGDLIDVHSLSNHPRHPDWRDKLPLEIHRTQGFFERLREVAPKTPVDYIQGNHEDRWDRRILEKLPEMRGIGVVLHKFLELDHYKIRYVTGNKGVRVDAGCGQYVLCFHGHEIKGVGKIPGRNATKFVERFGQNIHIGHSHRCAVVPYKHGPKTLFGVEGGHLSDPSSPGMEYAGPHPDWVQAWAVYDSENKDSPLPTIIYP